MGEHNRSDKPRFVVPEKPKHPLGWSCEDCFHVVKDTTPLSKAMICRAHPPYAQLLQQGIVSIFPPVNEGEWCGEFNVRDVEAQARVDARAIPKDA